jgi:hypothetical protein
MVNKKLSLSIAMFVYAALFFTAAAANVFADGRVVAEVVHGNSLENTVSKEDPLSSPRDR